MKDPRLDAVVAVLAEWFYADGRTMKWVARELRAALATTEWEFWGLRYLQTGGWQARGLSLEEARKRAGAWQWMGATPIAVQRDPEYAAAVFAEGGELHPPIGSPAYETFIGRKIDATAPPPDAKANTHDVIPAQEVLDRAFVEEILGCLNEAVKLAERCRERHDPKILGTVIGLVAKAERLVNKAAGRS